MQVWDIDILSIVFSIYKLAKSSRFVLPVRRGPKGYSLPVRIAIVAYVVLLGLSYARALNMLEWTKLPAKMGLESVPSPASVSRWKKQHELIARALVRQSFLMLARGRTNRLIGVLDGSGFKLTKASEHYEKRVGKKGPFLLVTVLYAPEIDAIYDLVAAPNCNSENKAFWNYLLLTILYSGVFWGIVADKRYDDSAITEWLEAHRILTFIPARGGKLKPTSGPRFRANERYKLLMAIKNIRSLVESAFSSIKSFTAKIRSKLTKPNELDALILALSYNVARLIKKGEL